MPIRFRKFLRRFYYLFSKISFSEDLNYFWVTWPVDLRGWFLYAAGLHWRVFLTFLVDFLFVCLLIPSLIISQAIKPLFLRVPNKFCFTIILTSLFYPNACNISLMMATWIWNDTNITTSKYSLFAFRFNCFTAILILLYSNFFTLLIIICKSIYLYSQINLWSYL